MAIRDNESPLMKWGTRIFTWPYLHGSYQDVFYFTQTSKPDKKQEFIDSLTDALTRYPSVDLFFLAHSNSYLEWVEEVDEGLRKNLRFVYNTGCYNAKQGDAWLQVGAQSYIGHPGVSWSPFFYVPFLRRWVHGDPLQEAMDESNVLMEKSFRRLGAATRGAFDAEKIWENSKAQIFGNTEIAIGGMP